MADDENNEPNEEETNNQNKQPTGKALREKLETTLARLAEAEGKLLIHEAGLSHLTSKQRNAAIRDATEDGTELTAESLKKSAKELGFPETPKPPVSQNGNEAGDGSSENNDGEGAGEGADNMDPANSMEAIERAQRNLAAQTGNTDFATKMAGAKTQAELEALIRSEGHKVGIVHEWDVE